MKLEYGGSENERKDNVMKLTGYTNKTQVTTLVGRLTRVDDSGEDSLKSQAVKLCVCIDSTP